MGNARYKIKGIILGSKPFIVLILLFSCTFFCLSAENVRTAFINSDRPETVSIEQIIKGEVKAYKYVEVSGYTDYKLGYVKTKDNKTIASYFALVDRENGYMLVVEAEKPALAGRQPAEEVISGLLYKAPERLKKQIDKDRDKFKEKGYVVSSRLYLKENSRPPSRLVSLIAAIGLGILALASFSVFFFPDIVFVPMPIPLDSSGLVDEYDTGPKAWGKFIEIEQLEPKLVMGTRSRELEGILAQIVPYGTKGLLILVHYVEQTKTYYGGFVLRTSESDWGLVLNGENVVAVESGMTYGWRDKRAVRFRYTNEQGKEEQLILSFDSPQSHANAVRMFQKIGFTVQNVA